MVLTSLYCIVSIYMYGCGSSFVLRVYKKQEMANRAEKKMLSILTRFYINKTEGLTT